LQDNQPDNLEDESPSPVPSSAPPPPEPPKHKAGFGIRAATGLCIALVYAAVILFTMLPLGPRVDGIPVFRFFYDLFVILIALAASLEMCRAIANKYAKPLWFFVILNTVLGFSAFYVAHFSSFLFGKSIGGNTAYFFVLAAMCLSCIIFTMFSKKHSMNNVLSTILVLVYPTALFVFMLSLNYLPAEGPANSAILLLFLLPVLSDTMAYLVGSAFRGPKLVPHISPKKTVSGAIGGVVGGIAAGAVVFALSEFMPDGFAVATFDSNIWLNLMHYLIIGSLGAAFVIVGDLIASYLKRQCGVKDFGKLLPGHGGVMDRVDSMILSAVFLYAYFYIFFVLIN